ncbi:LysR substrate-binding domain-containing protein [Dongia sp.]|uniref:LysR substrate-binding domain-containing protein n=1 Tax=Dongia sp. TaxID=1977262 RepID=UPI0035B3481B
MAIPFTLRQLEYLIAVAERGSITAAAAACHVAQPSVSLAIRDLEALTGKSLFRRYPGQKLAITPAGKRMLVHARATLVAAGNIADGGARRGRISGEVTITCFRDLGAYYLPRLLTPFARRFPAVAFRVAEGDLDEVRAHLADGRCEIAITYDIDLKAHGIKCDSLDRLSPIAMLPVEHSLAGRADVPLARLASERLILEDFPRTLSYFLAMFRIRGIEPRNVQLVPSFEIQRGLIASGWGVGLSCVRPRPNFSYDGTPLICRPLVETEESPDVVIAHLGINTLSSQASRFVDAALRAQATTVLPAMQLPPMQSA